MQTRFNVPLWATLIIIHLHSFWHTLFTGYKTGSGYKARVSYEILAFTFYMVLGLMPPMCFIIFCVSEAGAYPLKKSSVICAKTGKYLLNLQNQNHISDSLNKVLTTR